MPRPVRRGARIAGLGVIALILLLVGLRSSRGGVLPGVRVAGVDVGSLSQQELRERLRILDGDISSTEIVLVRTGGGAKEKTFRSSAGDSGLALDVERTAEAVWERGRQGNPVAALVDHLRAFFASSRVEPVVMADGTRMSGWLDEAAEALTDPVREGDLRFEGIEVDPVYPRPGIGVEKGDLRAALEEEALRRDEAPASVPARVLHPQTDEADVDALVATAEEALSAPIVLHRGEEELVIEPEEIAVVLEVAVEAGSLALVVDPKALRTELGERFSALGTEPQDASFSISGEEVVVVPSTPGFAFDPKRTAEQIVDLAIGDGRRRGKLKGHKIPPDFSSKDARALDVTERVSTFTTYHSCCEPRVENIHRAADLIDGLIVEPGETFSLNEAIGPRTTERGFVGAPAISDGEFVEEVGGGISQLATTTFNAIFFGGYDLLEYKAHSYYISRYPPGREATISTPSPDLVFLNDSDSGIFIDTSYSDTAITVSFYGSQEVEIESVTGERENVERPEERCKVNRSLAEGEEVVVQEGLEGFDIVVERVFTFPNGDTETEIFSTHYASMPRIVERKSCKEEGGDGKRSRER